MRRVDKIAAFVLAGLTMWSSITGIVLHISNQPKEVVVLPVTVKYEVITEKPLVEKVEEFVADEQVIEERDDSEVENLARIIWAEAGNQPEEGQYAVAWVVRNRVESEYFPNSYDEVIFQNNQFSGATSSHFNDYIPEAVYDIAWNVYLNEDYYRIPSNVLFFKTVTCNANWNYSVYRTIGDHTFYSYGEE